MPSTRSSIPCCWVVVRSNSPNNRARRPGPKDWRVYVFSRSLNAAEYPAITVVNADIEATVARLRGESGRDIWLFGGGTLFAGLLAANLIDEIELAIMPVLLGHGIPLAGADAPRSHLKLTRSDASASGILRVQYEPRSSAG